MTTSEVALGPYVGLQGLSISQLPRLPEGMGSKTMVTSNVKVGDGTEDTPAPPLQSFITSLLHQSIPFIDGVAPKSGEDATWKSKGSPKKFPASDALVYLTERTVPGKDVGDGQKKNETWYCRRSCHKNEPQRGTASWEEFKRSFKDLHAETEKAFVPTVIGAREAMRWDTSNMEVDLNGEKWHDFSMVVEEMTHRIDPKPLKNRTFPMVQLTAALVGADEFLVISIPLHEFEKSAYAQYAQDKSLVVAAYAAIERIRILPDGEIEWIMATASDARGILPQWVQNMAVPGAIAKDVQMFLEWIPSQRIHD